MWLNWGSLTGTHGYVQHAYMFVGDYATMTAPHQFPLWILASHCHPHLNLLGQHAMGMQAINCNIYP